MSADLVTWLRACLDEDERADPPHAWTCAAIDVDFRGDLCDCDWPARVLAEVTAKREIIEEHQLIGSDLYDDGIVWCQTCSPRTTGPCRTLRLLAAPFASRPGFDPSWLD